jgi:hypothetical protein
MDDERRPYREKFEQYAVSAARDFDRIVATLSAAALGLSIAFVRDLFPSPTGSAFLMVAWGSFSVALLASMFSFLTSERAHRNLINQIDSGTPLDQLAAGGGTRVLNIVAAVGVTAGVGFLVWFAYVNL